MSKNKIIIVLGLLVALMPLLGFPRLWESFSQVTIGFLIIIISVWASIDKRLSLKAKAQRRQIHKHRLALMQKETEQKEVGQETLSQEGQL